MPEDRTLPAELLECCLAGREAGGLRALVEGDPGLVASGWRRDAERWAARMEVGDELWTWSTPRWSWQNLCGRAGLAIVRGGKPVDYAITMLN
jgi:hypothetical protein